MAIYVKQTKSKICNILILLNNGRIVMHRKYFECLSFCHYFIAHFEVLVASASDHKTTITKVKESFVFYSLIHTCH